MKKLGYAALLVFVLAPGFLWGLKQNKMTSVKVSTNGRFGPEISMEFEAPIYCVGEERGDLVTLYFQDVRIEDFKFFNIEKLLRELPTIETVAINNEAVPVPRVIVRIKFKKDSVFKFLLTNMQEPNCLILNIFEKQEIEKIKRASTTLKVAYNGIMPDEILKKKDHTLLLMQDMVGETMGLIITV
jgi:hypothetical protein